jgi:hypothetical protein
MDILVEDPPISKRQMIYTNSGEESPSIHIYLSYDEYLPAKNFFSALKSINELYEQVYFLLYNERVSFEDLLILDQIHTGNSIDVVMKLIEKLTLSKKALTAIAIVIALITAKGLYSFDENIRADTKMKEFTSIQIQADTEKSKVEKQKALAEIEKIKMENVLLDNKIRKDSIEKINSEDKRKKLFRKAKSIRKNLTQAPINKTVINTIVIFGDNSEIKF